MDDRLFFTATRRNRAPIGEILQRFLPENGSVLEIASGSGEHGIFFHELFPNLNWQTSEPNSKYRKSIKGFEIIGIT